MKTYITQQADSWDLLAFLFWGSEYLLTDLVEANQKYRHYIIFPNGIELNVPEIELDDDSELPEWLDDEEDTENDDDDMEGLNGNDEDNEIY